MIVVACLDQPPSHAWIGMLVRHDWYCANDAHDRPGTTAEGAGQEATPSDELLSVIESTGASSTGASYGAAESTPRVEARSTL
jgi:hypothetical protein